MISLSAIVKCDNISMTRNAGDGKMVRSWMLAVLKQNKLRAALAGCGRHLGGTEEHLSHAAGS